MLVKATAAESYLSRCAQKTMRRSRRTEPNTLTRRLSDRLDNSLS